MSRRLPDVDTPILQLFYTNLCTHAIGLEVIYWCDYDRYIWVFKQNSITFDPYYIVLIFYDVRTAFKKDIY